MSDASDKTQDLIKSLSDSYAPQKPIGSPIKQTALWTAVLWLYFAAVLTLVMHVRANLMETLAHPAFLFEIILSTLIGLSASYASAVLRVPDQYNQRSITAIPLTLLASLALWLGLQLPYEGISFAAIHFNHCATEGLLLGIIPLSAAVFSARKGATTHPLAMGYMNILSIAAYSYVALRLACSLDSVTHSGFYHSSPYLIAGLCIGFIARKLYKW